MRRRDGGVGCVDGYGKGWMRRGGGEGWGMVWCCRGFGRGVLTDVMCVSLDLIGLEQ